MFLLKEDSCLKVWLDFTCFYDSGQNTGDDYFTGPLVTYLQDARPKKYVDIQNILKLG